MYLQKLCTQAVSIKAQLLALSERNVLVRKARKFELPRSNTFSVITKNKTKRVGVTPLPPRPNRVKSLRTLADYFKKII